MTEDPIDELKKNASDANKRLYALEGNFKAATVAGVVVAGFFGVSGIYLIPSKIKDLVDQTAAGKAAAAIQILLTQAQLDTDQIAKISQNGTIKVGDTCFKPTVLSRCYNDKSRDNSTWLEKSCGADYKLSDNNQAFILAETACPPSSAPH